MAADYNYESFNYGLEQKKSLMLYISLLVNREPVKINKECF